MDIRKVVLRNENGVHISTLTDAAEIERLERRASAGEVIRSVKMKRRGLIVIFRLKVAELPPVEPSKAKDSDSALNQRDVEVFAGVEPLDTWEAERLIGHGLHYRRAKVSVGCGRRNVGTVCGARGR